MKPVNRAFCRTLTAPLAILLISAAAASAGTPSAASAWASVERLQPGRAISITFRDGAEATGWVIRADGNALHYFRQIGRKLPPRVQNAMTDTCERWPDLLGGRSFTIESVKLSIAGIFDGDAKVVDHVAVPREEIRAISDPDHSPVAKTVLGIVGGFVGFIVVASQMHYPGDAAAATMIIGMPAAGGVAGYLLGRGRTFYRAPEPTRATLDQAAMQRIFAGLPASLRGNATR